MALNKNNLISTAFLCGFVLICGVACSALLYECVVTIEESVESLELSEGFDTDAMSSKFDSMKGPLWLFGLVYVIPGLIGLIGCCTQSKCIFITHMIFSIISLLIMGLAFIGCIVFIGAVASNGGLHCKSIDEHCVCMQHDKYVPTGFKDCSAIDALYKYFLAMAVVICLAWIVELASTIMSGRLSCCSSEVDRPGYIIPQVRPPLVVMTSMADQPQVHDHAMLVHNVHY